MNKRGYNHFTDSIHIEDVGRVEYDGYEEDLYLDYDQKWKGSDHVFILTCCVWLAYEDEPRMTCVFGKTKEDALGRLRKTVLIGKVFSECRHTAPEQTLRETLDSQEYFDGLKRYGLIDENSN